MKDPFDLQRFLDAQHPLYGNVIAELRGGRKRTHWMWFIFPQVEGLGLSSMSQHYAVHSRAEAVAYLAQPLLGARLVECTRSTLQHADKSAHEIFGSPDDLKFHSSMTLFDAVGAQAVFDEALQKFYGGERDDATIGILKDWAKE